MKVGLFMHACNQCYSSELLDCIFKFPATPGVTVADWRECNFNIKNFYFLRTFPFISNISFVYESLPSVSEIRAAAFHVTFWLWYSYFTNIHVHKKYFIIKGESMVTGERKMCDRNSKIRSNIPCLQISRQLHRLTQCRLHMKGNQPAILKLKETMTTQQSCQIHKYLYLRDALKM
jgi:hypothetical protein